MYFYGGGDDTPEEGGSSGAGGPSDSSSGVPHCILVHLAPVPSSDQTLDLVHLLPVPSSGQDRLPPGLDPRAASAPFPPTQDPTATAGPSSAAGGDVPSAAAAPQQQEGGGEEKGATKTTRSSRRRQGGDEQPVASEVGVKAAAAAAAAAGRKGGSRRAQPQQEQPGGGGEEGGSTAGLAIDLSGETLRPPMEENPEPEDSSRQAGEAGGPEEAPLPGCAAAPLLAPPYLDVGLAHLGSLPVLQTIPGFCMEYLSRVGREAKEAQLTYDDVEVMVEVVARAEELTGSWGGAGGPLQVAPWPGSSTGTRERKSRRSRKGRSGVTVSSSITLRDFKVRIFQVLDVHPDNAQVRVARV